MLISLVLIASLTLAGLPVTYLLFRERSLMWRLAAGNIIGGAIYGTLAFAAACIFGFTVPALAACLVLSLSTLVIFANRDFRKELAADKAVALGKLQGVGAARLRAFAYYTFFFLLFWFFFDKAIYELKDGLYTGGSNNLGDLPYHLGAILGFTDGNNFPPQNPSWAGARFSYPFIADFLTACFMKLGSDVRSAIVFQDVAWAMSLLVVLEGFARSLSGNKLVGRLAPFLLFFSGGLGIILFAKDYWVSGSSLYTFLWHLPQDYTIGNHFRWGNSMCVLFLTQRSLLFGMPLTIIVLERIWAAFSARTGDDGEGQGLLQRGEFIFLIAGLLAGTLPLIHLHSLAVLFVVTAAVLAMRPAAWRLWIAFGVGAAIIAIPELIWSMKGSATDSSKFFEWHFGWDKGDYNIIYFWLKNTALAIPLILAAIYIRARRSEGSKKEAASDTLLRFYIPFAFLFVLANAAKLAPWEWDNIKLLIYWYVASTALIGIAIVWLWERKQRVYKVVAAAAFAVMISAGALDVWRTASGQVKIRVFDRDAMVLAEQIKQNTEPDAIFLNAPTYNSAVVLSGRLSLMRYSGHLSSHGIDYGPREDDVKKIYLGGGVSDVLMRKYNIGYVLISPEEQKLQPNEESFRKYPIVAESGPYRVYKVK